LPPYQNGKLPVASLSCADTILQIESTWFLVPCNKHSLISPRQQNAYKLPYYFHCQHLVL
jgi:hypothetical protein